MVVSLDVFLTNVIWSWQSPWSKSDQSKGQWPKVTWINFRNFTSPRPISGMGIKLCPFLSSQISFSPQKLQIRLSTFLLWWSFLIISRQRQEKKNFFFISERLNCSILVSLPMKRNVFDFMCSLEHFISQIEIKWKSCMELATKPIQLHGNKSLHKVFWNQNL